MSITTNYIYLSLTLLIISQSIIVKCYEVRPLSSKYSNIIAEQSITNHNNHNNNINMDNSLISVALGDINFRGRYAAIPGQSDVSSATNVNSNDDGNDSDDDDNDNDNDNDNHHVEDSTANSDSEENKYFNIKHIGKPNLLAPVSTLYLTNIKQNSVSIENNNNYNYPYKNMVNEVSISSAENSNTQQQQQPTIESYVLAYINYTFINHVGHKVEFSEEKGKYGEGKILNVNGTLVHITDKEDPSNHTGCSPYLTGTNGDRLPEPPQKWIALIQRGACNFEVKVRNVYALNAVGVIIYNDRESGTLDKMRIKDKDRNITAIFTHKWLGTQMADIVEDGHELFVSISEGRHAKPMGNINRTSVLFVSISFIVLMIISLIWLIFYYVQRFRYLQTKDRKSRQMCSVAKRIISKIPTKSIKSDDKEIENDCCAICIEPYKVTDIIRMLPCRHDFHKSCIDPWLLEHRTCPMCKMDILKHYGFVFTGSQESILQLDMDTEDGDDNDSGSGGGGGGVGGGVGGVGIGGLSGTTIGRIDVTHHRDRMRTRSVSPTYIIQLDHPEHTRRSSVESVISCQRNGESPQIRILNEAVVQPHNCSDSIDGHKKPSTNSNTIRIRCGNGCMSISKHHSIDDDNCAVVGGGGGGGGGTSSVSSSNTIKSQKSDKLPSSLSLPCTLKKCRGNEHCNHQHNDCNNGMSSSGAGAGGDGVNSDGTIGSAGCSGLTCNNNCYVWTLDFQELNKKIDIYEKGHSSKFTDNRKSANFIKTIKTTADDDDDGNGDGDGEGGDDQICLSDKIPSQDYKNNNNNSNSKEIKGDRNNDNDEDDEETFDNLLLSSSKVI